MIDRWVGRSDVTSQYILVSSEKLGHSTNSLSSTSERTQRCRNDWQDVLVLFRSFVFFEVYNHLLEPIVGQRRVSHECLNSLIIVGA